MAAVLERALRIQRILIALKRNRVYNRAYGEELVAMLSVMMTATAISSNSTSRMKRARRHARGGK